MSNFINLKSKVTIWSSAILIITVSSLWFFSENILPSSRKLISNNETANEINRTENINNGQTSNSTNQSVISGEVLASETNSNTVNNINNENISTATEQTNNNNRENSNITVEKITNTSNRNNNINRTTESQNKNSSNTSATNKNTNQAKSNEPPFSLSFAYPVSEDIPHRFHLNPNPGINFQAPEDTQVIASEAGTVIIAKHNPEEFQYIIIQHSDNVNSFYGPLNTVDVSVGQHVNKGQPIALSGKLRLSAFFRFEIRVEGIPVDPIPYLTGES